jgi:hypothetical protein
VGFKDSGLSIPALFTIAFADGLWHVGQALLIVVLWELAEDLGLAVVFSRSLPALRLGLYVAMELTGTTATKPQLVSSPASRPLDKKT